MGNVEGPSPLLARLSWRFGPPLEEVAADGLAYLLNRYPTSRSGVDEVLQEAGVDLRTSHEPFTTEAVDLGSECPDLLQRGEDEENRLLIAARFYARLTPKPPVPSLEKLSNKGVSALMFLAPTDRVDELWGQILSQLDGGVAQSPHDPERISSPRCVQMEGTSKRLLITDWTKLLDAMERRLAPCDAGLAELRQLRGLVRFAESKK